MKKLNTHLHPTIKEYTNSYQIACEYDSYYKNNNLFTTDCEFIHDHFTAPAKILDLGCGTGRHLLFLESMNFNTFGIDLSRYFLNECKKKLNSFGYQQSKLIQGDILHLPLNKNATFDGILIMFSVLGLIMGTENRINFLKSLKPHLNRDGKIIIHVHNYNFRFSTLMKKLKILKTAISHPELKEKGDNIVKNYRNLQNLYIHSFTLKELNHLFARSGYIINNLMGLNPQRDGKCANTNINKEANGFLISISQK